MNMNQFPKRKSPRANFHNYSKGIFFITICTKNKQYFFGKIINGNMIYTQIGQYTVTQLQNISQHYPYAEVFELVVMPNHVHFMIEIFDKDPQTHNQCEMRLTENQRIRGEFKEHSNGNIRTQRPCVPTNRTVLSIVIGGFKRAVTLFARRNNIKFEWQSRYHDHIIRDFYDFNKIGEYIRNNIGKWEEDCFYQM